MDPLVHILTLNWNNWPFTSQLLSALADLRYARRKIVVVDNGSSDDSVTRLAAAFPGVEILQAGRNLGFAAGNNVGLRKALEQGADYAWLINNDARPAPDALDALVRAAEASPRAGAVGSAVYDARRPEVLEAWGGGTVVPWRGSVRPARRPGEPVEYITGTSMLLRCEALRQAGLFDEQFFLYWEDADLCRTLAQKGWLLAVAADSRVWHASSTTAGRDPHARMYHIVRSCVLYLRKGRAPAAWWFSAMLVQALAKLARGQWAAARGAAAGWRDGRKIPVPSGSPA